jgi:hypothetical protein
MMFPEIESSLNDQPNELRRDVSAGHRREPSRSNSMPGCQTNAYQPAMLSVL